MAFFIKCDRILHHTEKYFNPPVFELDYITSLYFDIYFYKFVNAQQCKVILLYITL